MYEITVIQDFAAAHRLYDYQGQCSNIHGHTWRVEVSVGSPNLNKCGMVMDFRDLKAILGKVLSQYDHKYLNEIEPFIKRSPTAENIAEIIYRQIQALCPQHRICLVKVWESSNSCASYRGDNE